jgi:hypothetical protein
VYPHIAHVHQLDLEAVASNYVREPPLIKDFHLEEIRAARVVIGSLVLDFHEWWRCVRQARSLACEPKALHNFSFFDTINVALCKRCLGLHHVRLIIGELGKVVVAVDDVVARLTVLCNEVLSIRNLADLANQLVSEVQLVCLPLLFDSITDHIDSSEEQAGE